MEIEAGEESIAKKSDALNQEQRQVDQKPKRDDAFEALRRLREVGEKLPAVDAAAIIREGRDLARRIVGEVDE